MSIQPIMPPSTFSSYISDRFSLNSSALAATTALVAGVALAAFEVISWLAFTSAASAAVVCYLVSRYVEVLTSTEPAESLPITDPLQSPLPITSSQTSTSTTSDEPPLSVARQTIPEGTEPPLPILPTTHTPPPRTSTPLPTQTQTSISTISNEPPLSIPTQTIPVTTQPTPSDLLQTAPTNPLPRLQPVITTPLKAPASTERESLRDQILKEVKNSPQRILQETDNFAQIDVEEAIEITTTTSPQTLTIESGGDSQRNSEVSDPNTSSNQSADELDTSTSFTNPVAQRAKRFGTLTTRSKSLPSVAKSSQTPAPGGNSQVSNPGLSDSSSSSSLRKALFSPSAHNGNAAMIQSAAPERYTQQKIEYQNKIVELYKAHADLITEMLDFDETHPDPIGHGQELEEALKWIRKKKSAFNEQKIEIEKVLDGMMSANLLRFAAKETFVRELGSRKTRLDKILDDCRNRIRQKKK